VADIYVCSTVNNALAAATAETLIQLVAPATVRARIIEFGVMFDGVTSTAEPVDIRLVRQTTAGTASAGTLVPLDAGAPTSLLTSQITFTAEPTNTNVLGAWMIHPQGGMLVIKWDLWAEAPVMNVSTRLGLEATAAATVNTTAYIKWVE
jgi:hypothetical protein